MPYVTVEVDASDVIGELSDDELQRELDKRQKARDEKRAGRKLPEREQHLRDLLEQGYRDLRGRCDSQALRDYFYEVAGKIL